MRQRRRRERLLRRVGVDQERQDRMRVRRRGDLDLPAAGRGAIEIGQRPQDVVLDAVHQIDVGAREAATPPLQRRQLRILLRSLEAEPGEIEQRLQIAQVRDLELAPRRRLAAHPPRLVAPQEELRVAGQRPDHGVVVGGEEMIQQEAALRLVRLLGRDARRLAEQIGAAARVGPRLVEQDRRQVDRHPHPGELLEHLDHVVVRARGVQAHPRQPRDALPLQAVLRLVQVPEERDGGTHGGPQPAKRTSGDTTAMPSSLTVMPRARSCSAS
jgi:hypothetical protein